MKLKNINIEDPFPWDERTSLVIYAAHSIDDNPDLTFPSFAYHEYDPIYAFIADGAPYLTCLDAMEMLQELNKWIENEKDSRVKHNVLAVREWAHRKISDGHTHFLYELEPAEYAGNSYTWALEAEKRSK